MSSFAFSVCSPSDTSPESTAIRSKETHIRFLAADSLKGRETGTEGENEAGQYITDHFEKYGLQPAGDDGSYWLAWSFIR